MAINSLIHILNMYGFEATVEHDDGTWSHTPEYNALRYRGVRGLLELIEQEEVARA